MAKTPGRDQRGPMERLVRIAATLRERGTVGETGDRLAEIAGFDGERPMDQLKRDIRSLTADGSVRFHPAFFDLDAAGREELFAAAMRQRQLDAVAAPDGLSATARAVMARIRAAGS